MAQQTSHDTRGANYAAAGAVDQVREMASEQLDKVVGKIESAAKTVAVQGREMNDQVQVVAGNFKTAVDRSVRDQPLTTLALAAAVAFVLGALWKS